MATRKVINKPGADIRFLRYTHADRAGCLALFDANCPQFFAPNEREDYEAFLDQAPERYETCWRNGQLVGVFGLSTSGAARCRLNWIMLDPQHHGVGIGSAMMERVMSMAQHYGAQTVDIAASQKSAGFFATFGAREIQTTENGWGVGMHRVDMEL